MVVVLPTTHPQTNLAAEEFLLQNIELLGPSLLFYVNSKCVVLGKHQNPWVESNPEFLKNQNIPLLRRFSGGGTVFHDEGNLNFSFLMPPKLYREEIHFQIIQECLSELRVESTIDAHKSLWHGERKFSGSAFARKLVGNIHHGTLLIKSDLDLLQQTLQPAVKDLNTKAPRSRRAQVINLTEVNPAITAQAIVDGMARLFAHHFPEQRSAPTSLWEQKNWNDIIQKHHSWNWVFGNTPDY